MNNSPSSPSSSPSWRRTLIILFLWLIILNFFFSQGVEQTLIPYSQFINQVEANQVASVKIGQDQLQYRLKPDLNLDHPEAIWVTLPVPDNELLNRLKSHNIEFSALPPSGTAWIATLLSWLIPPLIFVGIWLWFLNRSQGETRSSWAVGKSKARIYAEGTTGVRFSDVAGVDEAKLELKEIVDLFKNTEKYTSLGAKIPKGILLVGPPGTGKTLLARAIAGEASVPFLSISGSEFIELFVGVGASRVRDLFEQAKQQAPCIIFIDELDALGKTRGNANSLFGGNDEREQTLNQLLSEMDGFTPNNGIILLAATNRPEVLDPALLRPGRFDRQIVVDRPDKLGREAILNVHARNVKLAEDVDLSWLAARTPGFAGADLANLINEAALLAARQNREAVRMEDFNQAIERLLTGLAKKSRVLNEIEKKTVAHHEVGHALIGALMPGAGTVEKISIVPRGIGALGYTLQLPEEDRFLMLEDEIRGRIATLLGGRAAETLIFHKVSTGASDDIQKATDLAERFITLYGMSQTLGPIAYEKQQQPFMDSMVNPRRVVSPKIAESIDMEVKQLINEAYDMCLQVLRQNQTLLEKMAQILLEKEVLEGKTLQDYLQKVQPPLGIEKWLLGESVKQ